MTAGPTAIILIAVVVVVLLLIRLAIVIVRPNSNAVVERVGRFRGVLEPGTHLILPVVDRVRARVDRREQVAQLSELHVTTSDNKNAAVSMAIYFAVSDPRLAVYESSNYAAAVAELANTTIRNLLGGMTMTQARESYHPIRGQLESLLRAEVSRWGVMVSRIELVSIDQAVSNA
ncbi:SPFH domain/Band 7 family protein [Tamaricihabitans halophyticus]|uniref:SPFH domain/Band 7 family protein n=1 Tax=Tamaricihabitans halophyticus TaxID=1262583 RepID=A0A4R2QN79_9PSEU|nr:SPFH domain-containing protein [Tamaricihabitans halophyticus]TCP50907.1 SPFH domain/Band 7 family protein [Tamaricihabitans halophyticus]